MRFSIISLATLLSLSACATASDAPLEDRILEFGCDDVVVIGRITTRSYDQVSPEDDLLGHGWFSATIRVRRTVKGRRLPSVVPVRYYGHARFRDDREFMFVLGRTGASYDVVTAQGMAARPRLAKSCK